MIDSLRQQLADQLDILGVAPAFMICQKKLASEKCRNEIELFTIGKKFFAGNWKPLPELLLHVQKRQKGEVPGTENVPEAAAPVAADPAFILSDGKISLLGGFLDTDIHLGRFDISVSGVSCVAEYHPAYHPASETVSSQKIVFIFPGHYDTMSWKFYAEERL